MIPRKRLLQLSISFLGLALLFSLFLFVGCAARQQNITGLPAGVTQAQVQNWDTAVAKFNEIALITSALRQSVIALNGATITDGSGTHKILPDSTVYVAFLQSIGKIDQAQIDAAAFLKAQPKNWGTSTQTTVRNDVALITAELHTITSQQLTGVKNAGAVNQLQQLITQLGSAASAILALTTS
jgi:hypothetical protein